MSYVPVTDPKILEDISRRKEFAQFSMNGDAEKYQDYEHQRWFLERLKREDVHLDLNSYQAQISNFMDPSTPYARILLKWLPGMGKTITAVDVAMKFIRLFSLEAEINENFTGAVTIVGFTDEIFKRELLSYPRYGYVTREELHQLAKLRELAVENKTDQERYTDMTTKLKKRLTSRINGGFFRFYGYKAFVSRIFRLQDAKRNINDMSEDDIKTALRDGSLKFNKKLLDSFKQGLLICDEIQESYNSVEKNNWGIAIQAVLDAHPTLKALFMSATPINNSPSEAVDIANMLNPPERAVTKAQLFEKDGALKPGALAKLAELFRGKISFVQDNNPAQFARSTTLGETIPGIRYLKFTRCPMSDFHYQTYQQVYTGALSQDSQYLVDIAFPNPEDPKVGLYRTNDIKKALSFVDDKWVKKNGFRYADGIITGPGFDESRIGTYSSKYARLLQLLKEQLRPGSGKMFVYHNVVHISGVLFIEQLLLANGFIGIDQSETNGTLCATCGKPMSEHTVKRGSDVYGGGGAGGGSSTDSLELHRLDAKDPARGGLQKLEAKVYGYDEPREFEGEIYAVKTGGSAEEYVGFVEYGHFDDEVTIASIVVHPGYRKKGVARMLLEKTMPSGVPVTLRVWKGWRESASAKEFFQYVGFVIAEEDDDYWFMVFVPDTVIGGGDKSSDQSPYIETIEDKIIEGTVETKAVESKFVESKFVEDISAESKATEGKASGGKPARQGKKLKLLHEPGVHKFVPARFMVAHSDMDKSTMQKHIDRFNMDNNLYGDMCKIIIGSKIVKQSYNFIAVVWHFIIGRPDNINTLIQIMGRVLRSRVHSKLPVSMRHVTYRILTTCMPTKKGGVYELSHEEIKYREKVNDYIIIQAIEKVMHEEAIDGVITRNIILPSLDRKDKSLGALWYEPKQKFNKKFRLEDLNLSTFDVFHSDNEVDYIVYLIKRIFIEISPVFQYGELWRRVQHPHFTTQLNTTLLSESNFIIALDILIFRNNSKYVQPINVDDSKTYDHLAMFDFLHQTIDKRIVMPDGSIGYIHHIGQYYMYVPMDGSQHLLQPESMFRSPKFHGTKPINIYRYVREVGAQSSYETRKRSFRNRFEQVPFASLSTAISAMGARFHIQFIEEIVKYVFDVWTNPFRTAKSEYHDFYFKMLYFYDAMGLVVWASTAREFILELYKGMLLSPSESKNIRLPKEMAGDIEGLSKSMGHVNVSESISSSRDQYYSALKISNETITSRGSSSRSKPVRKGIAPVIAPAVAAEPIEEVKVEDEEKHGALDRPPKIYIKRSRAAPHLLPIGHLMSQNPRFYHPDKDWFDSPEYTKRTREFKENDIIIGYHEKSPTSLRIKFKIRRPMHLIERHRDIRMVEKGSMCTSNSKATLEEIARKLGAKLPDKINVPSLCLTIEQKLIMNELEERRKKSNKKWFYQFWETRPDERGATSASSSS